MHVFLPEQIFLRFLEKLGCSLESSLELELGLATLCSLELVLGSG